MEIKRKSRIRGWATAGVGDIRWSIGKRGG